MAESPQRRAVKNYRERLRARGMTRFEVLGRTVDRDLIRSIARRLAEGGAESEPLLAALGRDLSGQEVRKGGVLAALRSSPLVGTELRLERPFESGRKVDL
jgi:hypothetical protein